MDVLPAYAGMIHPPLAGAGQAGVLPAYAGMILDDADTPQMQDRAPRVCGDDPAALAVPRPLGLCSPRMRG